MAHPVDHAASSARRFGGRPDDYVAIHNWFDESKSQVADFRHRALRHHARDQAQRRETRESGEPGQRQGGGEGAARDDQGSAPGLARSRLKNLKRSPVG